MMAIMQETEGRAVKATGSLTSQDYEKVAVVSDKKWVEWATKIGSYFMDGRVATYIPAEFKGAVAWAKQ